MDRDFVPSTDLKNIFFQKSRAFSCTFEQSLNLYSRFVHRCIFESV